MYGKSKYAGEKLVRELTDKHVIVRSSWLYGVGSYDFVDRVLDTAAKEGAVHLPEDEISSPTSAEALGLREHCAAPALYAAGQYDAAHHWFVSNAGLA